MATKQKGQELAMVPIGDLKAHPDNPRKGDIAAIRASIEANGFYGAVVAQRKTGYILVGSHRWMAAQEAGVEQVPCLWLDVDDERAKRILLADNRTSDLGSYDDAMLADLLSSLGGDLAATGYDDEALDELLASTAMFDVPSGSGDSRACKQEALKLVVLTADIGIVERALSATGLPNRGAALAAIAEAYLGGR